MLQSASEMFRLAVISFLTEAMEKYLLCGEETQAGS